MNDKFIVAIEIGSSRIKGALAALNPTSGLNIIAVEEEPLVDSVRYGQVKNVEEVAGRIDRIRTRLENSPAIAPRKIEGVYVGISGLTVGSSTLTAQTVFDAETEITANTVENLKRQAKSSTFSEKEIYQTVARDFTVDNMATANPIGTFGRNMRATFIAISGSPALMSNIKRVLPERLGLDIRGAIVTPVALGQSVLTDDEKRLGSLLVDFGAETTTVAIYKGGALHYLATLPMGSRNITRDLTALNFLEERAEEIKRSIGLASRTDDTPVIGNSPLLDQPEINNFISARTAEIIANILAHIEFAGFKATDLPAGIILTGGGARMKGFSDAIGRQSNMKVRTGHPTRTMRISDTSVSIGEAADIISLIESAADLGEGLLQCVAPLPTEHRQLEIDPETERNDRFYGDGEADGDDYESRIGRDWDDDDDLLDDEEDDHRKPVRQAKKSGSRPSKKEERTQKSSHMGFLSRIRNQMTRLVTDEDLGDEIDDEENE